jgi:hypothetical protein
MEIGATTSSLTTLSTKTLHINKSVTHDISSSTLRIVLTSVANEHSMQSVVMMSVVMMSVVMMSVVVLNVVAPWKYVLRTVALRNNLQRLF